MREEQHVTDSVQYLTTDEVAKRYRTSPSTIRYWRHTGYLKAGTQFGRRTLYDPAELDEFDRQRRGEEAGDPRPCPAA
jgi:DNA-binding transcriptional MerR regulator